MNIITGQKAADGRGKAIGITTEAQRVWELDEHAASGRNKHLQLVFKLKLSDPRKHWR